MQCITLFLYSHKLIIDTLKIIMLMQKYHKLIIDTKGVIDHEKNLDHKN